jgi:hypothetical protein
MHSKIRDRKLHLLEIFGIVQFNILHNCNLMFQNLVFPSTAHLQQGLLGLGCPDFMAVEYMTSAVRDDVFEIEVRRTIVYMGVK